MSTKIEYDDAISTIGTLQKVEPHQNYNLLKWEEIINTCLVMIPSTQFTILGWTGMFMIPEIYALLEPNPWQDIVNHGAVLLIWESPWLRRQNVNIIVTYEKF